MQAETTFKVVFGVWAVLFLGAIGHAQRKTMGKHGARFAQGANEYPPLLWIRGLVGISLLLASVWSGERGI